MSINRFSKVFVPSEYIAPFDLNTYANIGAQKDAQFERNLQLLQSDVNQIAQIDILRPQDREVFSRKLASIVNDINSHGTEDLGDTTLLNSMENKQRDIYGDQKILTSIGETQKVRRMQNQMEDDRKKGKLATQNEDMANDYIADYLDPKDPTVGKSFEGRYVPHYEYARKVMDVMAKARANGYITRQTSINGGLQTETIKTKGLTDSELTEIAYGMVKDDPQAQEQMQIDARYLSKRMTAEGVTADFQRYAEDISTDYKNQIAALEMKKQEASKAGDKDKEANYTGKIKEANDELIKYEGWASKDHTASTMEMISQNKNGYYAQVFEHNFYKNAASIFSYQDQTRTVTTNMEAVMNKKFEQSMKLATLRKGGGGGGGGGAGEDGFIVNLPANEENNAQTEEQLIAQQKDLTTAIGDSVSSLRGRMSDYDSKIYGSRYSDAKNGDANFAEDYKKWQTDFNDGKTEGIPLPVREHFEQVNSLNNKLLRTNTILKTINDGLKTNTNFIKANGELDKAKSFLPESIDVKDNAGNVKMTLSRNDVVDISTILKNKDYVTKKATLYTADGKPHEFEYRLLNGSSAAINTINQKIETNVAKIKQGYHPQFWLPWTSQNALEDQFRSAGIPTGDYLDEGIIGKGVRAIGLAGSYRGVGAFFDDLLVNHTFGTNNNRQWIDAPLSGQGIINTHDFYGALNNVGDVVRSIKNEYFNKAGIATMSAVKTFSGKEDEQNDIRPVVQTLLPGKVINKVINVGRNSVTGNMFVTYTTDKDNKKQETFQIPAGMEGTFAQLFPVNESKDIENDLQRISAFKQYIDPKSGEVSTSADPTIAYTVSGTNKKVRYFYHPGGKFGGKFGYRLYNGNEVWLDEHYVNSLDEVPQIVRTAAKTEKEENERRETTASSAK